MIRRLLFVTNNAHKLTEIRQIAGNRLEILSLADAGFNGDIEETAPDLEGNALLKARYLHSLLGLDCFADDTGLEVDALGGAPGVISARYAGENATYADNVNKLLLELGDNPLRSARFRTVIALILDNREYLFEGRVEGMIAASPRGTEGFGYDPVFIPEGVPLTFAELTPDEKNRLSHRGLAVQKLMQFLKQPPEKDNKSTQS